MTKKKKKEAKAFLEEQKVFKEFCQKEYIYELEGSLTIKVIPSMHELPHLLALHKYESFDIINTWVNRVDIKNVNAHTILHKLDKNKLTKADFEKADEYKEYGERIKHFTKPHLQEIIYNVRVFKFDFDPRISDNEKAEWSLLREFREIGRFLQLLLFKKGTQNEFGLLSLYIDKEKNPCIEPTGKRINKLTVYDTSCQLKKMIFHRDYIYLNELREKIKEEISEYHRKNDVMYRSEDQIKETLVKEINIFVSGIFCDIEELFSLTDGDLGLTNSGREFLKLIRDRHPDLIQGFRFIT